MKLIWIHFREYKEFKDRWFKNINYKRLFYDIRNSQYLKPSVESLAPLFYSSLFPAIGNKLLH